MQTSEVLVELVLVVTMTFATSGGASLHVELRIPAHHKQPPSRKSVVTWLFDPVHVVVDVRTCWPLRDWRSGLTRVAWLQRHHGQPHGLQSVEILSAQLQRRTSMTMLATRQRLLLQPSPVTPPRRLPSASERCLPWSAFCLMHLHVSLRKYVNATRPVHWN